MTTPKALGSRLTSRPSDAEDRFPHAVALAQPAEHRIVEPLPVVDGPHETSESRTKTADIGVISSHGVSGSADETSHLLSRPRRKRRPSGSGSVSFYNDRWHAHVQLRTGATKHRVRRTEEEALEALRSLFEEFRDQLGYHYVMPRPYFLRDNPYDVRPVKRHISPRTRFAVLARDNHTCQYCGAAAPHVRLVIDHVKPVRAGGTNDLANLVAACVECNSGKAGLEWTQTP